MKRIGWMFIVALLLFTGCRGELWEQEQGYHAKYKIGILFKSMGHQHWMDMRSGVIDAARELNVETIILYPSLESAMEEQKAIFTDLVKMDLDAILFAPCDSEDCSTYVQMAVENNIVVLNIDTRSNDITLPYIGADNEKIGALAAEHMAELMGYRGSLAIVSGVKEQASHQERINGFQAALQRYPLLQIQTVEYANSDFRLAMESMEKIAKAFPDIDGIFCTSAVMGLGVIEQKKNLFLNSNPHIVAVDTQDDALNALKNGTLVGLVAQDGYEAGYRAVQAAVARLDGEEIPQNIYIDTPLITRSTVEHYLEGYGK